MLAAQDDDLGKIIEVDDTTFEVNSAYISKTGENTVEIGNAHTVFVDVPADVLRDAWEDLTDMYDSPDDYEAGHVYELTDSGINLETQKEQPVPFLPPMVFALITDGDGVVSIQAEHGLKILDKFGL